jgi:hypothetical protein
MTAFFGSSTLYNYDYKQRTEFQPKAITEYNCYGEVVAPGRLRTRDDGSNIDQESLESMDEAYIDKRTSKKW